MKRTLGRKLVKVILGQSQVKFRLDPIGLKIGENKPGCDGSMKQILRSRLVKVIQGQGKVSTNPAGI